MDKDKKLSQKTHPTVKAFFDALDSRSPSSKRQSETLRRRTSSLGWRNRHSQAKFYPVSIGETSFSVQQVQRGEVEGTYGTGATVWPAAMVLIKYLEQNQEIIQDKKVVDLGTGTGVTSIASAVLGAKTIICTDGEESVVALARENINHASKQMAPLSATINVQKYWWGDGSLKDDDCDVVLVADCVLRKFQRTKQLVGTSV